MERLNNIRQGTRPFREFLTDFDGLLLEAEIWSWDDTAKKAYLKLALSLWLLEQMVGTEEKASYTDYCGQLRKVSDDLASV